MNKPGSFRRLVRNLRKQAENKKPTSKRREMARDAAEEFCRAVRRDISNAGGVTYASFHYHNRWMRLSGKHVFSDPKPLKGNGGR